MEEQAVKAAPKKRIWLRLTAATLAVLLPGIALAEAVGIRFSEKDYEGTPLAPAAALMQQNTKYLEDGEFSRITQLLRNMGGEPGSFEEYDACASIAIAREQYDKAIGYMQGCIATYSGGNTGRAMLLLKQGSLYALTGQYREAVHYYDMAEELHAGNADVYLLRAQMYSLLGEATAAVRDIEQYTASMGEQPELMASIAPLYENAGEYQKAIECYTLSIETPAFYNEESLLGRARCRMLLGDLPLALQDITRYFEAGGADAGGQGSAMLGICLMSEQDYKSALVAFRRALESGYPQPELLYSQTVLCAYILQDYEAVIHDGEEALRLLGAGESSGEGDTAPTLSGETVSPAELHEWVALAKLAKQEYRAALTDFEAAAKLSPELSDIDYYRGVCHSALEEYEAAIPCFTASIAKGESVSLSYYNRGLCEMQTEDYKQSYIDLLMVLQRNDDADAVASAKELLKLFIVEEEEPEP